MPRCTCHFNIQYKRFSDFWYNNCREFSSTSPGKCSPGSPSVCYQTQGSFWVRAQPMRGGVTMVKASFCEIDVRWMSLDLIDDNSTLVGTSENGLLPSGNKLLPHWGRVTHICISKLTIIGSDNGLSPGRRQAIIWTNAGILLIRTLGTNFNEIWSEIHAFSFKRMHLKMLSAK